MTQLPQKYDAKEAESRWQQQWEKDGVYAFLDDQPRDKTFVIDTPPPTVSGVLHMGHIFSYTQADFIARYKRMRGFDVFYPMGFDDNGLPTERLVEKVKKIRAHAYISEHGREAFVEQCKSVVEEAEAEFKRLFTSVALSVDWKLLYQTISDRVTALSQASFLDLIAKDQAYRDFRPSTWDWVDQTAIATAEIEDKELPGIQITIPFCVMDKADWDAGKRPTFESLEKVPVMTTRPELLGACVALMCHPDDENSYKNKIAVSPLFNVVVPICFDDKVDKEKGTGFVMCCSWGDDTDKEWIAKHALPWRPLIDVDGKIKLAGTRSDPDDCWFIAGRNGDHGKESGLSKRNCFDTVKAIAIYEKIENTKLIRDIKDPNSAKGRMVTLLDEAGLLLPQGEKQEKIIHKTQTVKCAERSGKPIEIIPTYQWFVRITDKKEALKEKGAKCEWHPEFMKVRLDQWIDGLKEDWCISRQRFFGVPFPVWYSKREGEEGKRIYADASELPIDPMQHTPKGYSKDEVVADQDVMDTWATSSISPQINAGALCSTRGKEAEPALSNAPCEPQHVAQRAQKLFPADLRPQAHEIIRTWAFYTIAKAHLHSDTIPWKHVMISGWCLASDKTKMSKSKGNVVTPVDLIEDKGADAVRYWASTSRLGADTAFSEDLLKIGKKLVGKIWNASNFITQLPTPAQPATEATEMLDKWILSRLHVAISKATKSFDELEYADARVAVEDFFWNDFCDNYLELVKARAYNEDSAGQASAHYTLMRCLKTVLTLFAPFVPHVTEEIYNHIFAGSGSIHRRDNWPNANEFSYNEAAERAGAAALDVLESVRKAKSEAGVSIKTPVEVLEIAENKGKFEDLAAIEADLLSAANANKIIAIVNESLKTASQSGLFYAKIQLGEVEKQA